MYAESMKYRDYMNTDLNQSQPHISFIDGRSALEEFPHSGCSGPFDVECHPTAGKEEMVQGKGKAGCIARRRRYPVGFFTNLAEVENAGFDAMSDVGNFGDGNGINAKSNPARRSNDHIHFSSGQSSSSRYMPQIAENGNESRNQEDGDLGNDNSSNGFYVPSFENNFWNESNLSVLKRNREGEDKLAGFHDMGNQNGKDTNYPNRLTHHLSLPKTSGEIASMEKYLHFQQDAVPCKIRARRGCATHPRSIAERMRKTRISDRIKKLQELLPDMDKQTNTADMLDLAVEYIKNLQNQVQTLTTKKTKCTCIR